jgi:hypothetical protein
MDPRRQWARDLGDLFTTRRVLADHLLGERLRFGRLQLILRELRDLDLVAAVAENESRNLLIRRRRLRARLAKCTGRSWPYRAGPDRLCAFRLSADAWASRLGGVLSEPDACQADERHHRPSVNVAHGNTPEREPDSGIERARHPSTPRPAGRPISESQALSMPGRTATFRDGRIPAEQLLARYIVPLRAGFQALR